MSNQDNNDYFIAFYASFFAVSALEIPACLVGFPPLYRPINPSPPNWARFWQFYRFFEMHLTAILQYQSNNPSFISTHWGNPSLLSFQFPKKKAKGTFFCFKSSLPTLPALDWTSFFHCQFLNFLPHQECWLWAVDSQINILLNRNFRPNFLKPKTIFSPKLSPVSPSSFEHSSFTTYQR